MKIAEIRYSEDNPQGFDLSPYHSSAAVAREMRIRLLSDAVRVSPSLFPDLAAAAQDVIKTLRAECEAEFYVRNDPQAQAFCMALGEGIDFAVALNSGLIDLLSATELRFVLGHEIGHYLFGHHNYPDDARQRGEPGGGLRRLCLLHWRRAAEVSADRAGFVCAPSEQDAFAAILKTASGLSARHLRIDAMEYQQQAKEVIAAGDKSAAHGSHPIFPLRARALHWFAMSEPFYRWRDMGMHPPLSKQELDDKVRTDFIRAESGGIAAHGKGAKSRALLWSLLACFIADKILSKAEQRALTLYIGEREAKSAMEFARTHGVAAVTKKQQVAVAELRGLPLTERKRFIADLRAALDGTGDFSAFIRKQQKSLGLD
jgi:hypothetical protein